MAVQEEIERSLDLKRDLAAYATPPECCHSRLLARYERLPLGQSIGVFALAAYSLMILAVLLLPETRGRELTAEAVGFVT
jgi:hypothetical protein